MQSTTATVFTKNTFRLSADVWKASLNFQCFKITIPSWLLRNFPQTSINAIMINFLHIRFWVAEMAKKRNKEMWNQCFLILHKFHVSQPSPEKVVHRCSVKKQFCKYLQSSQQNPCVRVPFLVKLQTYSMQLLFKKNASIDVFMWKLWFFQKSFFIDHLRVALLDRKPFFRM